MALPTDGYTPLTVDYSIVLEGPEDEGGEYIRLRVEQAEGPEALAAVDASVLAIMAQLKAAHPTWRRRVGIARTITGALDAQLDVP